MTSHYELNYYIVFYFLPSRPLILINRLIKSPQCAGVVDASSSTYGKKFL